MSSDHIKNILAILYDEITSGIYCIMKSKKKIERTELENKLREKRYNFKDLNLNLGKLIKCDFIDRSQQIIKNGPTEGVRRVQKPTKLEILTFKNPSIKLLKSQYEDMKKQLFSDLEERQKKKYICPKCKAEIYQIYDASRIDFKCKKCGSNLENIAENVIDLRIKCQEIINVIDELFKEEEKNSNTGVNYYYNNYLTSKFGKNYFNNNDLDSFEEDQDNYICKTLNNLQEKDKMNFYELVEGFIRSKKK